MTITSISLDTIRTLEDTVRFSKWAAPEIQILRNSMKPDSAHDEGHLVRVVRNAIYFTNT